MDADCDCSKEWLEDCRDICCFLMNEEDRGRLGAPPEIPFGLFSLSLLLMRFVLFVILSSLVVSLMAKAAAPTGMGTKEAMTGVETDMVEVAVAVAVVVVEVVEVVVGVEPGVVVAFVVLILIVTDSPRLRFLFF